MVCSRANELISEYIDGVLEDRIKLELEAHFRECHLCKQRLEEQKAIIKRLNSVEPVRPPDDFLQQVHTRLERRAEFENLMKKAFVPGKKKMSLEVVGVLVTVVLVIVAYQYIQKDFPLYPDQLAKIQTVTKGTKVIRSASSDLGESEVSISERRSEHLGAKKEKIIVPENKGVSLDLNRDNRTDSILEPSSPSFVHSQSDVSSSAVKSRRTGTEAQQAWESAKSNYDQSSGPTMKMESQSLEQSKFLTQEIPKSIVNAPVQENIEKNTEVSTQSIQEMRSGIMATEGESVQTESAHFLSQKPLRTKSVASKGVPLDLRILITFQVDAGKLPANQVYSYISNSVSRQAGSIVSSESEKDGVLKSIIVRVSSKNMSFFLEELQKVGSIIESSPQFIPPQEVQSVDIQIKL